MKLTIAFNFKVNTMQYFVLPIQLNIYFISNYLKLTNKTLLKTPKIKLNISIK